MNNDLSYRLQLYIYTLQHYEDFPFLTSSILFPPPFFSDEERKSILSPDIQKQFDEVFQKKINEKKPICTAHDIVPIILKNFQVKVNCTKKDVKRFLKKK